MVIKTPRGCGPRQIERWKDEIRFMKRLECENIVKFIDVSSWYQNDNGLKPLGMEYCSGGNLRTVGFHIFLGLVLFYS